MAHYEQIIKGKLPLPNGTIADNAVIAINNEKIVAIYDGNQDVTADSILDTNGSWILPGGIDAHVHCYSEPREGVKGATRSAAAGGITTIIEMPYDADEPVWSAEKFNKKLDLIQNEAHVDVAVLATIRPGGDLSVIHELTEMGACGFKMSTFNTHSYRFPRIHEGEMVAAFKELKEAGRAVGLHAENDDIVRYYSKLVEDKDQKDPMIHCEARPAVAEAAAVATALELAKWTGVHLHFHHTTIPRAIELVKRYQEEGVKVSVETCIQYLTFTEENMKTFGAKAKINPPLRQKEDMEALWEMCQTGDISFVASDHAPWQLDRKQSEVILENASGSPGVETLFPVLFSEGVMEGRLSIFDFIRLMSTNPARVYGLSDQKGSIEVGKDADIVIIDPNQSFLIKNENQHSFAGWSLYDRYEAKGKITHSFVRGKLVYDGENVVSTQGQGRFVRATHDSLLPIKGNKGTVQV
ncbi:dihydroorotase [Bacillus sp. REN16]|uniref:dihydroorotase n=1 Tax=Bacillus sp. REN16 TaxID=2887296 RepID=UPI001E2930C1|nr:dihydroorotase family protein [Bacillus sp. REN16]MCC3359161.1 dihydroorotase family protein [Bacillus sp. REN16]